MKSDASDPSFERSRADSVSKLSLDSQPASTSSEHLIPPMVRLAITVGVLAVLIASVALVMFVVAFEDQVRGTSKW